MDTPFFVRVDRVLVFGTSKKDTRFFSTGSNTSSETPEPSYILIERDTDGVRTP